MTAQAAVPLNLNPRSHVPIYVQLIETMQREISTGRLLPGQPLPSVQSVAEQHGISTATVMRAYKELSHIGLIISRSGSGTIVAPSVRPTTEILLAAAEDTVNPRLASFYDQLAEGVRLGYGEPGRRIVVSMSKDLNADEVAKVCRVRRTDGIVAYNPDTALFPLLRHVAAEVPVVSVAIRVPDAPVDAVLSDPASALEEIVRRHVQAGARQFIYADTVLAEKMRHDAENPYLVLRQAFGRVVRESGLPVVDVVHPRWNAAHVGEIPAGAVVYASHPQLALKLDAPEKKLTLISYTECRSTLELARGRVTTLYLGLEMMGRAAVALLKSRKEAGSGLEARTVRVKPEVFVASTERAAGVSG